VSFRGFRGDSYLIAFEILLLANAFFFVFNPLGRGPEPDIVLSRGFFFFRE
jgi:hypothetical protein